MHNNGVVLNAYDYEHEHFLMNTYHIPCGTYFSASCAFMQCLIILHFVQTPETHVGDGEPITILLIREIH